MHESESSPSHSVLEFKSSHKSLNLAHKLDSSPSPGLEYYNTALLYSTLPYSIVPYSTLHYFTPTLFYFTLL